MASLAPIFRDWASQRAAAAELPPVLPVEPDDTMDDAIENENPNVTRKRGLQNVNTKAQRVKVLKWMEETAASRGHERCLISEAVRQFPDIFQAPSSNANLIKCARWWKLRRSILEAFETDKLSINHTFEGARKRVELKSGPGRGRKTTEWVSWLYPLIKDDFKRLKAAGLKFSPQVLQLVAKNALLTNPHPTFFQMHLLTVILAH